MIEELAQAFQAVIAGGIFVSPQIGDAPFEILSGLEQPAGPELVEQLSNREYEVLQWLAEGKTVAQIAEAACLSIYTIYTHISNIKKKLSLSSTAEIIRFALKAWPGGQPGRLRRSSLGRPILVRLPRYALHFKPPPTSLSNYSSQSDSFPVYFGGNEKHRKIGQRGQALLAATIKGSGS